MRPIPATSVPINGRGFCESGVCVCVLNNSPENGVDLVDLYREGYKSGVVITHLA